MAAARTALSLSAAKRIGFFARAQLVQPKAHFLCGPISARFVSSHQIKNNIELISKNERTSLKECDDGRKKRPLLVLISWLGANRRHYMKLVNFYMEQNFDVAVVTVHPRQLLWPVSGTQVIAADLLAFLHRSKNYEQIVLHGFSVAGYMLGEVMEIMSKDRNKYEEMMERIVGQIYDSAVDVSEIAIGTPVAVFPKNQLLQNMLRKYLEYHLRTFHKQATQHYIRSSQHFHSNFIRAPALFFISKADPIGTLACNLRIRDSWDSLGTQTYTKIFEKSPHVGHFRMYPKEYVIELNTFLGRLGLINDEEKIKAHIQN